MIDELAESGVKYNPDDVVMITKSQNGELMWLEKGNSNVGLEHITQRHSQELASRGVSDIPVFIDDMVYHYTTVETGMSNGGKYAIYNVNDDFYHLSYGTNGYVVSFRPHTP